MAVLLPAAASAADLTVGLSGEPTAHIDQPFTLTATFSEPVHGFTKDDVDCTSCSIDTDPANFSNFRVYTFEVKPDPGVTVKVKIRANTVTATSGGAQNQASEELEIEFDGVAPTPEISVQSNYGDTTPFVATIEFDEDIVGFSDLGDVAATNATATAPQATSNPRIFTSTITPKKELRTITVRVPRNAAQDLSGRPSEPAEAKVRYLGPSASIVHIPSFHDGTFVRVVVFFSQPVTNFTAAGVECDGCVAAEPLQVDADGQRFRLVVTPDANEAVFIQVKAGAAQAITGGYDNSASNFPQIDYKDGPILNLLNADTGDVLGGTRVTLHGFHFGDAGKNYVHFGSVRFDRNEVTWHNNQSLTVISPPAPDGWPGPVDVHVEVFGDNPGESNTFPFEYTSTIKLNSLSSEEGKAGDTITLTGAGFEDGNTTVYVNNAALDGSAVTFKSTTELDIVMPRQGNGPEEQLIGVGVANKGRSNRLAFTYTVVAPTLTRLSLTSGPLEGGDTLTLYGTEFVEQKTLVKFGERTIQRNDVTFVSSAEISITVPTATQAGMTDNYGPVDVSVEVVNAGTSGSLPYTYYTANATLQATGGSYQKAKTDTAYTANFLANISTSRQKFVDGAVVTFSAPTSGASGTFSNGLTSIDKTADANGDVDSGAFTANGTAGDFDVTASSLGTSDVTFAVGNVGSTSVPTITSVSPGAGPMSGGDVLTVVGTGFIADDLVNTAVKVGTAAATVTAVTSTTITATTTAHSAGTVDVQVTTLGGGPVTKADAYRYLDAPKITSLSREVGAPREETEITITGTNFLGADSANTTVEFSKGQFGTVAAVTDTSITVETPPLGVGTVDVIVTTLGGVGHRGGRLHLCRAADARPSVAHYG